MRDRHRHPLLKPLSLLLIATSLALVPLPASLLAAEPSAPQAPQKSDLFRKDNLAAWCIVPYDKALRSPEDRAEMVAKIGLKKIAYDWRAQHVAEFEREILAYQKHGLEMSAFWGIHDSALSLFEKYNIHPQLWVVLGPKGDTDEARTQSAAAGLLPILERAKKLGSQVGIYNHGGWGGEPENMVAVCEFLKKNHGVSNVGIIYNLHHGHTHLSRLPAALEAMKPWLLCINLNGMMKPGGSNWTKILPIGAGSEDRSILQIVRDSGYTGTVGIINHTGEDAELRLLDNLDGLAWINRTLQGQPAGSPPVYRSWKGAPVE